MRECAGVRERQEHPAYIPWVYRGGRDELRSMGLAHLAIPDKGGSLERGWNQLQDSYCTAAEELQEAMDLTAMQVLQERRRMMASLIDEVVVTALEEEVDHVEVLRSIAAALIQDARGTGGPSEVIADE